MESSRTGLIGKKEIRKEAASLISLRQSCLCIFFANSRYETWVYSRPLSFLSVYGDGYATDRPQDAKAKAQRSANNLSGNPGDRRLRRLQVSFT